MSTYVHGRGGLGDAIYSRPFVRAALARGPNVFVETSWPWVFSDLPVQVVKRVGGLAVQAFHGELNPARIWAKKPPRPSHRISLRYRWSMIATPMSITEDMRTVSRLRTNAPLDLPPLPLSPFPRPYAVVRPPAVRRDFPAPAREPDPRYLATAAVVAMHAGLDVVTVGMWLPGLEERNGYVPADHRFENGELTIPELFALVAGAAVCISSPCWLVPACLATRTPLVVIAGGCGGRNSPEALVDPRQDTGLIRWLLPDQYCRCGSRGHDCPKHITNLDQKLDDALASVRMVAA